MGEDGKVGEQAVVDVGETIGETGKSVQDGVRRKRGRPRKDNSRDTQEGRGSSKTEPLVEDMERLKPEIVSVDEQEIPKTKKKKQKKSAIQTKDNIKSIFSILSNFTNPMWELSDEECEKLAEPLDSILSRYELFEKISKYGDVTALMLTSFAIFTPRILLTMEINKQKKKEVVLVESKKTTSESNDTSINANDTADVSSDIKKYLNIIS